MDAGGSANGEAKAAIETALQTFIEDEIPIEFRNVTAQHLLPRLLTALENRDFFAARYILLALSFSHVSVNQFQICTRFCPYAVRSCPTDSCEAKQARRDKNDPLVIVLSEIKR